MLQLCCSQKKGPFSVSTRPGPGSRDRRYRTLQKPLGNGATVLLTKKGPFSVSTRPGPGSCDRRYGTLQKPLVNAATWILMSLGDFGN